MSDSDEKKELGGLARSIDSLFAGGAAGASGEVDGEAQTGDAASASVDELQRPLPPPDFDSFTALPEVSGSDSDASVPHATDSDASVPDASDSDAWVPQASVPDASVPDAPPSADPRGAAPRPSVPEGEPTTPADLIPTGGAEDDSEPTPLALAVESYLAGGGDASRIRDLARGHVQSREYDPVAAAVERLAQVAGRRSDAEALALATSLVDPIVRGRVVQRLGRERDERRRLGYHEACRALGEPMAIAIRDELADTSDRFARRAYFDALVAMGEVSRRVIEAMADDENRFLARNGVAILGEIGGGRAEELAIAALANTDPRVRRAGLLAMAKLDVQVDDVDQIVVGLLEDTETSVRLAAVAAAGELRVERAVRPLVARLEDSYDADEVLPLLHALGQIGDPGAVPAIEKHAVRELFAKPRTEVRIAAYQALNHIGTPHARRLLNQAIGDKDPEVKATVRALLHIR